jgi:hypothetical protein
MEQHVNQRFGNDALTIEFNLLASQIGFGAKFSHDLAVHANSSR